MAEDSINSYPSINGGCLYWTRRCACPPVCLSVFLSRICSEADDAVGASKARIRVCLQVSVRVHIHTYIKINTYICTVVWMPAGSRTLHCTALHRTDTSTLLEGRFAFTIVPRCRRRATPWTRRIITKPKQGPCPSMGGTHHRAARP